MLPSLGLVIGNKSMWRLLCLTWPVVLTWHRGQCRNDTFSRQGLCCVTAFSFRDTFYLWASVAPLLGRSFGGSVPSASVLASVAADGGMNLVSTERRREQGVVLWLPGVPHCSVSEEAGQTGGTEVGVLSQLCPVKKKSWEHFSVRLARGRGNASITMEYFCTKIWHFKERVVLGLLRSL